jgi:Arylsulfatase A and related enzymes
MSLQTRRQFMAATAGAAAAFAAPGTHKQNILMIAIDDLNDWIGCLGGHPDVKTPNLDRRLRAGLSSRRRTAQPPSAIPRAPV